MFIDMKKIISSDLENYEREYKNNITAIRLGLDVNDSVIGRYSVIRAMIDNGIYVRKKSISVANIDCLTDLFIFRTSRTLYLVLLDEGLILSLKGDKDIEKCLCELEEDVPLVFKDNITVGGAKYSNDYNKSAMGIYIQVRLVGYNFLCHQLFYILGQPTREKRIECATLYYNGIINVVINHIDVPSDRNYYCNYRHNKVSNLELTISNLNSSSIFSKRGKSITSGTIKMSKLLDMLSLSEAYSNGDVFIDNDNIYLKDILIVRRDMIPRLIY